MPNKINENVNKTITFFNQFIVVQQPYKVSQIIVSIGWGHALLQDNTKPPPQPMWTLHQLINSLGNTFQWNFNQVSHIFIHENALMHFRE